MRPAIFKAVLRSFAYLPLPVAHALGAALGWTAYLVPNSLRSATYTNLSMCFPDMDPRQRKRLVRRSLVETGKTFTEMGILWLGRPARVHRLIKRVSGQHEVYDRARAKGRGVVVLTPHLGAWELTSLFCVDKHPMTALYRPPRMQEMEDFVRDARQRTGARLVPTTASGVKGLFQALERGDDVGILPDQDPGGGAGVFAPFFGHDAKTMVLVPRLVQRTGATPVFIYAKRLSWGRGFHVHFVPAPPGMDEGDLKAAAAAMNRGVEVCVRQLPEQYQWSYKRFKTRPEGAPRIYS